MDPIVVALDAVADNPTVLDRLTSRELRALTARALAVLLLCQNKLLIAPEAGAERASAAPPVVVPLPRDELVTVQEAAERCRVTPDTIRRWAKSRLASAVVVSSRNMIRFSSRRLDEILAGNKPRSRSA
jgi:hypothetical protein